MTATTTAISDRQRPSLGGLFSRHAMLAAAVLLCVAFVVTSPVFGTPGNVATTKDIFDRFGSSFDGKQLGKIDVKGKGPISVVGLSARVN